jgi:hypothetical protein
LDEDVGYNYECLFVGSESEIFYLYGDFVIAREGKSKIIGQITNVTTSLNVDTYFAPIEDKDAKCRLTFRMIICTFNLPIDKEKT